MAGEIKASGQVKFNKGGLDLMRTVRTLSIDVSGDGYQAGVQDIAAASESVLDPIADATSPGVAWLRNISTDGSHTHITIGPEDTGAMVAALRLKPDEFAIIRLDPSVVLRAQSAGADGMLEIIVFED